VSAPHNGGEAVQAGAPLPAEAYASPQPTLGPGATRIEWTHFAVVLGLSEDLLPVVSNLDARISQKSSLKILGKVPSRYDAHGQVVGIAKWTAMRASAEQIDSWSSVPDYGICLQTRRIRAIDIDIDDIHEAERVRDLAFEHFGILPARIRSTSSRLLLILELPGDLPKRSVKVGDGTVELLGTGQQFIAAGTHTSGVRYSWEGGLPLEVPRVMIARLDGFWKALHELAGGRPNGASPYPTPRGATTDDADLDRAIAMAAVTDETIADIRSALAYIDPDDRGTWITVGCALKSLAEVGRAEEGCELWMTWGRRSKKFNDGKDYPQKVWGGLAADRIDYRAVFKRAQAAGWVNPRSATGLMAGATASTRVDRADAGNVNLLTRLVDGNLRYVPELDLWLWWDGARWTRDKHCIHAQEQAWRVAEHYYGEAREFRQTAESATLTDSEKKRLETNAKSVDKWAIRCRGKQAHDNMLNLAKADKHFVLPLGILDRDPWLFGVENGVVDLKTGQLKAAAREDYVTKRSPIRFDPDALAPRWERFIEEVTASPAPEMERRYIGRAELSGYLHRALGYTMTGSTQEHKMFIATGIGANGKSVLLDTLKHVFGSYCELIPPEALMMSRSDVDSERPTPYMTRLAGCRLAISSESKAGQHLNIGLVKRHTGDRHVTARALYGNPVTFEITDKLWLMTNQTPVLDRMDAALRDRLVVIPFDMRWNRPGISQPDPTLPDGDKRLLEKLNGEAEGILAWLVRGAVAYFNEGLVLAADVQQTTRDYLEEQDPLSRWIQGYEPCESEHGVSASELFRDFQQFSFHESREGSGPATQKAFSGSLQARGVKSKKTRDGMRYGLRKVNQTPSDLDASQLA